MTFDRDKTSLIGKCATLLTMFLALVEPFRMFRLIRASPFLSGR